VPAVAVIPATALLAGSALALVFPDGPLVAWALGLAAAVGLVFAARQTANGAMLACAVWAAFAGGGGLLTADAWRRAWRPSLRLAFEEVVAYERRDARQQDVRGRRALPEEPDAHVWLSGVLREDASPGPNGVSLSLDVRTLRHALFPNGLEVRGGTLITVGGTLGGQPQSVGPSNPPGGAGLYSTWRAGRTLVLPVQLRRPSSYRNEGGEDGERALARRGTTLVGSIKSSVLVEVGARGSPPAEGAAEIRAFVRRALARHVGRWSPRSSAIVGAIVIGDRTGLDDAVERRLQEAGTYHVIAISGGNIAILVGLTLVAFRVGGVLGPRAMLTAIAGLVGYAYIVGGGRSVERATLTAVLFLSGRAIDHRGAPTNVLAFAAGLLIVAGPLALADPGFLLTFGATVGILALAEGPGLEWPEGPGANDARREPWIIAAAVSLLRASIGAEAVLLPISAVVFSRVTLAGLVLNFAAIPLMAVAQIAGMAIVPLSVVWTDAATLLGWVAHAASTGLVRSADLVEWVPALTWRVAPPAAWVVGVYYAALLSAWVLSKRSRRPTRPMVRGSCLQGYRWTHAATTVAVVAAAWIAIEPWRWRAERGDGRLHATFIDVGQGDATWIRFPNGESLLVDTGGLSGNASFDIGDRVVAPVLRGEGVGRLGTLVLTHGDADHIGGARAVLTEFRPREVWEGIPVPRLAQLQELRSAAARVRAPWRTVQPGDRLLIADVELLVRHPARPDWERQDVRNEDSVVVELVWHDVSIWLTGDIGRDTEQLLAPEVQPARLRVVKVPHHGSLTSSSDSFLRALAPRLAVVSAGRNNRFGHPAPAVLARYQQLGASIFRTDQDGAVTVTTDGRVVDVETVSGRRGRYR
jgi:competence protein ComEC